MKLVMTLMWSRVMVAQLLVRLSLGILAAVVGVQLQIPALLLFALRVTTVLVARRRRLRVQRELGRPLKAPLPPIVPPLYVVITTTA
jgi:hypothetical protein